MIHNGNSLPTQRGAAESGASTANKKRNTRLYLWVFYRNVWQLTRNALVTIALESWVKLNLVLLSVDWYFCVWGLVWYDNRCHSGFYQRRCLLDNASLNLVFNLHKVEQSSTFCIAPLAGFSPLIFPQSRAHFSVCLNLKINGGGTSAEFVVWPEKGLCLSTLRCKRLAASRA